MSQESFSIKREFINEWGGGSLITIPANPFTFLMQLPQAMFRKCSQPFGGV